MGRGSPVITNESDDLKNKTMLNKGSMYFEAPKKDPHFKKGICAPGARKRNDKSFKRVGLVSDNNAVTKEVFSMKEEIRKAQSKANAAGESTLMRKTTASVQRLINASRDHYGTLDSSGHAGLASNHSQSNIDEYLMRDQHLPDSKKSSLINQESQMESLKNIRAKDLRKHIPQDMPTAIIDRNIQIIGALSKQNEKINQSGLKKFEGDLPLTQMIQSLQRQSRTHHEMIKTFNSVKDLNKKSGSLQ